MRAGISCAGLMAIAACAAVAQTGEPAPTFEAASVKPAPPPTNGRLMVRMGGGPGSSDPGRITYTNVALKNLLTVAYNVKSYQISGPGWLDSERFDITAKIPQGATQEQFQLMLQNLLAERFKLKLHRESKDMPIFALVVAKNGVKMKESAKEDTPAAQDAAGSGRGSSGGAGGGPAVGEAPLRTNRDGVPQLPRGGRGMIMMGMGGKMKMQANRQSTSQIAEMLANQVGRPVVDQTGLQASYDFELEFAPEDSMRMPGMGGMPAPPVGEGGGGAGGAGAPPESSGPSLMTAVQEQLGLKLEPKKGPVALLVIDAAEKIPTEN